MIKEDTKELFELGAWVGRHQAFGMIGNRRSAADTECLKQMRDGGHYKKLGLQGLSRKHRPATRQLE
jgi:hypothetical protein